MVGFSLKELSITLRILFNAKVLNFMSKQTVIKVQHVSKRYNIDLYKKSHTLRGDLAELLSQPLKWLKGISKKTNYLWVLKNINLSVDKGDVLGITGPNGAGKSTLLKILSRITPPTKGEIVITGRVSSILDIGTGFHPELTGKENIYLKGAILGMNNQEISKKFNQIVEFSGVEKFINTPLKRYSTGMAVRLAFSIAVHLEADILLFDEILAVGDEQFQQKSLAKMKELVANQQKTIIFVSHNKKLLKQLSNRIVYLDHGIIKKIDKL